MEISMNKRRPTDRTVLSDAELEAEILALLRAGARSLRALEDDLPATRRTVAAAVARLAVRGEVVPAKGYRGTTAWALGNHSAGSPSGAGARVALARRRRLSGAMTDEFDELHAHLDGYAEELARAGATSSMISKSLRRLDGLIHRCAASGRVTANWLKSNRVSEAFAVRAVRSVPLDADEAEVTAWLEREWAAERREIRAAWRNAHVALDAVGAADALDALPDDATPEQIAAVVAEVLQLN